MSEEPELTDLDQDDLYEHYRFQVDKGQALLRIDKFLINRIENTSRSKIQHATEANSVLVNGKAVKSNYRVKPGDIISIVMSRPPRDKEIYPENIPLDIVYEDDELIIVNKKPGMVVHPGYGNYSGTLVNALVYHFQNLPAFNGSLRPGLVHRIDKDTTGLMVVAKTEIAMASLAKEFFDRTIDRTYIALVWGDLKEKKGRVEGHIGRNLKNRKIMDVFPSGEYGKPAITHYEVLDNMRYVSLVQCKLETGRTHQIRVHFKHIGHPLFNDETYGGNKILKGTSFSKYKQFVENCFKLLPRHALHAKSIGFIHPTKKEKMFFDSELPKDFAALIEKWRDYISLNN